MRDLTVALGLVLVIEGVLYAGLPGAMKRMLGQVAGQPDAVLRGVGLGAAVVGLFMIWLIRG